MSTKPPRKSHFTTKCKFLNSGAVHGFYQNCFCFYETPLQFYLVSYFFGNNLVYWCKFEISRDFLKNGVYYGEFGLLSKKLLPSFIRMKLPYSGEKYDLFTKNIGSKIRSLKIFSWFLTAKWNFFREFGGGFRFFKKVLQFLIQITVFYETPLHFYLVS